MYDVIMNDDNMLMINNDNGSDDDDYKGVVNDRMKVKVIRKMKIMKMKGRLMIKKERNG